MCIHFRFRRVCICAPIPGNWRSPALSSVTRQLAAHFDARAPGDDSSDASGTGGAAAGIPGFHDLAALNHTFPVGLISRSLSVPVAAAMHFKSLAQRRDWISHSQPVNYFLSQLSAGQQQHISIARALAANPRYLLCDEVSSALDPETITLVLALPADINRQLDVTIVLITPR